MSDPEPKRDRTEEKTELLRGSVFMSISPLTSLVLGLLVTWLIQLYITPQEYAVYEWFNVMSSFFITLLPFQMPNAIGRYIAVSRGENDTQKVEDLIKTSTLLALTLVPLSGLTTFVITPYVLGGIGLESQFSLLDTLIFTFGVMALNLSAFTQGTTSGFQEFKKLGIAKFLANTTSQLVIIVLIPIGWGITALLLKFVFVGFILAIFLSFTLRKIWALKGSTFPLRPLFSFAYPSILAYLFAYTLNELLIRGILQFYSDFGFDADLGLFGFATRLVTFINAITLGYYNTLGLYYSEAYGHGGTSGLEKELQWTLRMSFFLFLPIIVGVIIISPAAFAMFFPAYYWGYQYFVILMIQMYFLLFVRPYSSVLGAMAKTKQVLASAVAGSIISGIAMFLVINWGLIIVVIAYASNALIQSIVLAGWVKKEARIKLGIKQIIPITTVSFFTIIPAAAIHFLRLDPFLELGVNATFFLAFYIGFIRLLGLIKVSEIQKATLFLPSRIADPTSRVLVRMFTRRSDGE